MRFWRFLRNAVVALAVFWALGHLSAMNTPVAQRIKGYVIYALTAETDFKASLNSLRDLTTKFFRQSTGPGR